MKPKTPRDTKYKQWIESLCCLVCQHPAPSIAHHTQKIGHGGKGIKTSDYRMVPLCGNHHDEIHRGRITFAKKYGFDSEFIIERLNSIWESNMLRQTDIGSKWGPEEVI